MHQLVLHLQDESIEDRERASARLIALGPDVLPEIREESQRADDPEACERLRAVLDLLESQDRLVRLVGRPRLVTLVASEAPLKTVLADLSQLSGVNVAMADLRPDLRVSLEVRGAPLWTAVDDLCRHHGGIRPEWSIDRVTIRPGAFQETPHVEWNVGPIPMGRLLFEYSSFTPEKGKRPRLESRATMLLAPGRRLHQTDLFLYSAVRPDGERVISDEGECHYLSDLDEGNRFSSAGAVLLQATARIGNTRLPLPDLITYTRGALYIRLSTGTRPLAALSDLSPDARSQDPKSHVTINLQKIERSRSEVRFKFWVTYPMLTGRNDRIEGDDGIRLVSNSGETWHPTESKQSYICSDMGADHWMCDARFPVGSDVGLSRLEVLQPNEDQGETIRIDFAFPRLPVSSR